MTALEFLAKRFNPLLPLLQRLRFGPQVLSQTRHLVSLFLAFLFPGLARRRQALLVLGERFLGSTGLALEVAEPLLEQRFAILQQFSSVSQLVTESVKHFDSASQVGPLILDLLSKHALVDFEHVASLGEMFLLKQVPVLHQRPFLLHF